MGEKGVVSLQGWHEVEQPLASNFLRNSAQYAVSRLAEWPWTEREVSIPACVQVSLDSQSEMTFSGALF